MQNSSVTSVYLQTIRKEFLPTLLLSIYTYAADFVAIYIPNLTEPDLAPTEVRSPLPAAFGRIEPTAIAFIFARHYLRPSAALTLQR